MPYNSIVISSGHGKYIRGAKGVLDEVDEARRVVNETAKKLQERGVTVKVFHDDVSRSQSANLNAIVNYHNSQNRQLDVSVHFNANKKTSNPVGTECLYKTQQALSAQISGAIAGASGLINRGAKYRGKLAFLNKTTKPAILIEICFVDSSADARIYNSKFHEICGAIADVLGGQQEGVVPPDPEGPPIPEPAPGTKPRPTIRKGSYGNNVVEVQRSLNLAADGAFGPDTDAAVRSYQSRNGLSSDGIVGNQTWATLAAEFKLPAYPPPLPALMSQALVERISAMAIAHPIASYSWRDRGRAPAGYVNGIAVAYAQTYTRHLNGDPLVLNMAKANTGNDSIDALSWYNSDFVSLGLNNRTSGVDTLRHLYVLLMGLGMRESSGKHCEGRDQSASNTSSDTAEAGLYQTSFNASGCCTDFLNLFDQYTVESPQGYMDVFAEDVSCSSSSWSCYGSGNGFQFQKVCKYSPAFAVETAAITLRRLRQHYGPINRKEAELRREADNMFLDVQQIVDAGRVVA